MNYVFNTDFLALNQPLKELGNHCLPKSLP